MKKLFLLGILLLLSCTVETVNLDDSYNYGGYFYARKPQSWVYRENLSNASNLLYSIGFYSIVSSSYDKYADNILIYVFKISRDSSYSVNNLYKDVEAYRDSLLDNYSLLENVNVFLADSTQGIMDIYKQTISDLNSENFDLRTREYLFLKDSIYYQILCNSEDSVYSDFSPIFDEFMLNFIPNE